MHNAGDILIILHLATFLKVLHIVGNAWSACNILVLVLAAGHRFKLGGRMAQLMTREYFIVFLNVQTTKSAMRVDVSGCEGVDYL
jgi:hypothetical protein